MVGFRAWSGTLGLCGDFGGIVPGFGGEEGWGRARQAGEGMDRRRFGVVMERWAGLGSAGGAVFVGVERRRQSGAEIRRYGRGLVSD